MEFWKMNGAGNDFIVVDDRQDAIPDEKWPEIIRTVCERHMSIGADGFMVVKKPTYGGDYKMLFFNSDGSMGEMCGNGARCICRYGYENGLAGEVQKVETTAGLVTGWRVDRRLYRVRLNDPCNMRLDGKAEVDGATYDCAYVELGNPGIPHAVKEIPNLTWDMGEKLRPEAVSLRYDPAFPKGANVNFYRWIGEHTVRVLTYERGVENYTLACGTGCGSVTCVLWALGELPGKHLITEVRGGKLEYHIQGSDHVKELIMDGPTEILKIYEV